MFRNLFSKNYRISNTSSKQWLKTSGDFKQWLKSNNTEIHFSFFSIIFKKTKHLIYKNSCSQFYFTFQPFQLSQPRPNVKNCSGFVDSNPGTHLRVQHGQNVIRRRPDYVIGGITFLLSIVLRTGTLRVEFSGSPEKHCSGLWEQNRLRGSGRSGERNRRASDAATENGFAGTLFNFTSWLFYCFKNCSNTFWHWLQGSSWFKDTIYWTNSSITSI